MSLSHSQRDLVAQEAGVMHQVSHSSSVSTFCRNEIKDRHNYKSVQQHIFISFSFSGKKWLCPSPPHMLDVIFVGNFPRPTLNHSKEYLLFPHYYNKLFDYSFSARAYICHTRLRLGFSCLREYLFRINRCASSFCECGIDIESVKHLFLFCPRYAAQRNLLLTSAANILGGHPAAMLRNLILFCTALNL